MSGRTATTLDLVGYADPLSVAPGERVSFHVSCRLGEYRAEVVRLLHGDEDPAGPGLRVAEVPTAVAGTYAGRVQPLQPGSYVHVPHVELDPAVGEALALGAWICPTVPAGREPQGILWLAGVAGALGLSLEPEGDVSARIGELLLRTQVPVEANEWHFVGLWLDGAIGELRLVHEPLRPAPHRGERVVVAAALAGAPPRGEHEATIGAAWRGAPRSTGAAPAGRFFDGRIARPRLLAERSFERWLSTIGLVERAQTESVIAAWDFSREPYGTRILDAGPRSAHGRLVNGAARAVPGPGWRGEEIDWRRAPEQWDAIHFHDDDLDDAGWEVDFALEVPADLPSGFYAARLRAGEAEDYVPFFVHPVTGAPTAPIALLAPTMTYQAYGNLAEIRRRIDAQDPRPAAYPNPFTLHANDRELDRHPEVGPSCYDAHRDGSPTYYSSLRRPLLSLRPGYTGINTGEARHLAADLRLEDWLVEMGHAHDVITDHDLHCDGLALLSPYRVVLTGTHPEYWTTAMLQALDAYLTRGGRLMYLGGNGFYWVTAVCPERPHVIEVRRGVQLPGRMLASPLGDAHRAGEGHTSSTGEGTGLWRLRGWPERRLVGVGFAASGWPARNPGYRRTAASFDERVRFIFEGVGDDDVLGDFGLACGGAAGDELDSADVELGTPAHALVVATSQGLHDDAVEGMDSACEAHGAGRKDPNVRADMTYFETPNGGAVFSVGSIAYCGSLSHNGYDNNISRITGNVLRAFLSDEAGPPVDAHF